jgi:hypothetical protein
VTAASETVTPRTMTSEMTTCVTGVPNMINYILPPHFELSNGNRLSRRHKKNKALYSWLSRRLSWSQQPSEKRPLSNRLWMFTEGDDEVVLLTPRQQGKGRTGIQIQPFQQAWSISDSLSDFHVVESLSDLDSSLAPSSPSQALIYFHPIFLLPRRWL